MVTFTSISFDKDQFLHNYFSLAEYERSILLAYYQQKANQRNRDWRIYEQQLDLIRNAQQNNAQDHKEHNGKDTK
jgi:hypothetical protein